MYNAQQLGNYQSQQLGHPMDGIFDDIYNAAKDLERDFRHSGGLTAVAQSEASKQLANLATNIASQPGVQQAGAEMAERALLEEAVTALQRQREQLTADLAAMVKAPLEFAQKNPMKAAMFIGIPLLLVGGIFMMTRRKAA